jgi:hypothetical protein
MGVPTRFTYGVGTAAKGQPLGDFPFPDPFHTGSTTGLDVTAYANDFFTIGSTTVDWTITGVSSTFALADGVGGVSLVTPGGVSTVTTVAVAKAGFQFVSGQKFWYLTRIKASAVAGTVAFQFGLHNGTGATPTDGIYFQKAASSTSLNLVSRVGSTSVTLATGIATAAAATYLDVGFYYNGTDLLVFASDNLVARVANVVIAATTSATAITNALLQPAFQITPTATDTLSIDYVLAAQETAR